MDFRLLSGSATGASHLEACRNNQDAFSVRHTETSIVAVVADGCSGQPHSEVGAKIVAPLLATFVAQAVRKGQSLENPAIWNYIRKLLLSKILTIATDMAGDDPVAPVLNEYFQFTLLGIVITPERTVVFSRGDGVFGLNGEITTIEPESGNRPAYIVYGLTEPDMVLENPDLLNFDIQATMPTSKLASWFIGVDGVNEWLKAAGKTVNHEEVVGIESLLEDERYHRNPDLLNRRLRQVVRADLVDDDVTVIGGIRATPTPTPQVAEEEITEVTDADTTQPDPDGGAEAGKAVAAPGVASLTCSAGSSNSDPAGTPSEGGPATMTHNRNGDK